MKTYLVSSRTFQFTGDILHRHKKKLSKASFSIPAGCDDAHTFNPITWEAKHCEFETSLIYVENSKTARATQWDSFWEKKKNTHFNFTGHLLHSRWLCFWVLVGFMSAMSTALLLLLPNAITLLQHTAGRREIENQLCNCEPSCSKLWVTVCSQISSAIPGVCTLLCFNQLLLWEAV